MRRRSKYGAIRIGGHASKKEHKRALQLQEMQGQGLISELQEQVPYILIPAQYTEKAIQLKTKTKIVQRVAEMPVKYIADFVYKDSDGNVVVEDTKGFRTADYIIKRKLMRYVHGISIVEI